MNETEDFLKAFGELPELESGANLSAKAIIGVIRVFVKGIDDLKYSDPEIMPDQFLELLSMYPESLCTRKMSETLKRVITAYYVYGVQHPLESYEIRLKEWEKGKRSEKPDKNDDYFSPFHSYEYLACLFGRSKASIHEAISQFKDEYEKRWFKIKDEYAEFQEWKKAKDLSNKGIIEQTNEQR